MPGGVLAGRLGRIVHCAKHGHDDHNVPQASYSVSLLFQKP